MELVTFDNQRQVVRNVRLGAGVKFWDFINLYECEIGNNSMIGTFVEIQSGSIIGENCRIQSHTFICDGVMLINDKFPRANQPYELRTVRVGSGASIGSGAVILGGVVIGQNAMVGSGAVVTSDVADNQVVAGVPARVVSRT